MSDYSKFKTPFYKVDIMDPSGKRKVSLPDHIIRLLDKVEITEPFGDGENQQFTTITLNFIEGSREPASPNRAQGTKGLYNIPYNGKEDRAIAGTLHNRPGLLTDLRFSGNEGITFLSKEEQRTGKIDTKTQQNVFNESTTRAHKNEDKAPIFLFQERNRVKVTWGYKEDPDTVRSVVAYIILVTVSFPESGATRTTITCQDTGAFFDQIATNKGKPFGTVTKTPKGNSIVAVNDVKTDELLRFVAKEAGMATIISQNLPADVLDKDKQKVWLAGESFTQFISRLAALHNAYWKIIPDPKTGKDTLIFIQKQDFESRTIRIPREYLNYRNPGSILKSVDIRVDFGGITGNRQAGITADGKIVSNQDKLKDVRILETKKNQKPEEFAPTDPTSINGIPVVKAVSDKVANQGTTGEVKVNTSTNSDVSDQYSKSLADKQNRVVQLEFSTLGYTRLVPGIVTINNIGLRYSGAYRVISVTHTLDNNGYTTKCSATSMFLKEGGVVPEANPKAQQTEKMVDVKVLESRTRDELDNFLEGKSK